MSVYLVFGRGVGYGVVRGFVHETHSVVVDEFGEGVELKVGAKVVSIKM